MQRLNTANDYPLSRLPGTALFRSIHFARRQPLGFVSAIIVLGALFMATLGPLFVGDPTLHRFDKEFQLLAPSLDFPLGTDRAGRDILAGIVVGARVEVIVAIAAVLLGSGIGAILGLVSGYYGGTLDDVIQRFVDSLMVFPVLVLAMAIVVVQGPGVLSIIIALTVPLSARASRVVRASALRTRAIDFVTAAEALGCSGTRIMLLHVAPQCLAPFLVISTAMLASAILSEAALSYLGFGAPPPSISWGAMLSGDDATQFFRRAPWIAIVPGVAISLLVFAVNMLGDLIRDVTDPRLRNLAVQR